MTYLVLSLGEGDTVNEITGVSQELNWDTPFSLEKGIVKMPYNIFHGKRVPVLFLRCEGTNPRVAYYSIGS